MSWRQRNFLFVRPAESINFQALPKIKSTMRSASAVMSMPHSLFDPSIFVSSESCSIPASTVKFARHCKDACRPVFARPIAGYALCSAKTAPIAMADASPVPRTQYDPNFQPVAQELLSSCVLTDPGESA
jgi:hypothetical protein